MKNYVAGEGGFRPVTHAAIEVPRSGAEWAVTRAKITYFLGWFNNTHRIIEPNKKYARMFSVGGRYWKA